EPLRLVHDVRRNVDRTAPLRAHIEEPPWTSERGAVDELLQMVHALLLDGRRVGAKGAEDLGGADEPLDQSGRDAVTPGHDLRGQPPALEARRHVLEVARLYEPRLVGEHMEA